MSYFMLTSKILDETSFLKFISRVNEDFIAKDTTEYDDYLANDKGFGLTVKSWLAKCADETLREDNGAMVTFKAFALNRIHGLMGVDMDLHMKTFAEGNLKDKEAFLSHLGNIMHLISKKEYLKPVSGELMLKLSNARTEIEQLGKQKPADAAGESSDYLVWNGTLDSICDTFHKLTTSQDKTTAKTCLDCSPEQLSEFISKHFRDGEGKQFEASAVLNALQGKAAKKQGKKKSV